MPNSTTKSKIIGVRLSIETIEQIQRALDYPANSNTSLSDYCKQVIERHAWRHSKRKYRKV